ncbi:hypothetical protein RRG08_052978 [Elysia crispata]|uniref:Uncharacterized protein n=1 Tax=Elysia crispata TaxID=231223 RepID=A0AAE1DIG5_9GAST|nr:hypothetical protein RRG08_052978 [Elysia crispata]
MSDHARPPKSPRKGKYVNIRIGFLNDTVHVFQVPHNMRQRVLFESAWSRQTSPTFLSRYSTLSDIILRHVNLFTPTPLNLAGVLRRATV